MKTTFIVMTLSLIATSVAYADSVCNTLEDCLALQTKVTARIKKLSPTPVTRTTISGHKFTQVTDQSAFGNAWKDESGLIWGNLIVSSGGNAKSMTHQQAAAYCNSLSDGQHQYLLPTKAQFEQLAKYLGAGSDSGYNPEIIPNLIGNYFWSGSVDPDGSYYAYDFYGSNGYIFSYYRNNNNSVRCVGR